MRGVTQDTDFVLLVKILRPCIPIFLPFSHETYSPSLSPRADQAELEPRSDGGTLADRVADQRHHAENRDAGRLFDLGGRTEHPVEFFGEISLIEHSERLATVTAKTPLRVFVLADREFRQLLDDNPRIERKVLKALARRLLALVEPRRHPTLA